jgi:hypothetical protein
VHGAGITVGGIDTATSATLAPFKAFILIIDGQASPVVQPSAAEAQALKDFVVAGGGLLVFYGYSATWPASIEAQFHVHAQQRCLSPGSASATAQMPSLIGNGPYGAATSFSWTANCHEEMSLLSGSQAVGIVTNPSAGHIESAFVAPGALGPNSGPVIYFTDFFDSYAGLKGTFGPLFKNAVDYVLTH